MSVWRYETVGAHSSWASRMSLSTRQDSLSTRFQGHTGRINHLSFRQITHTHPTPPSTSTPAPAAATPRQAVDSETPDAAAAMWREQAQGFCFVSASSDKTVRVWSCSISNSMNHGGGADKSPGVSTVLCLYTLREKREVLWCGLEGNSLYSSGRGFIHQWSVRVSVAETLYGYIHI